VNITWKERMSNATLIRGLSDAHLNGKIKSYTMDRGSVGRWVVVTNDGELRYWTSGEVRAFLLGVNA